MFAATSAEVFKTNFVFEGVSRLAPGISGPSRDSTSIVVTGGAGNDNISGTSGPDRLFGSAGDDTFYPNGGDDYIDGGDGNDRVYFALVTGSVHVDLMLKGPQDTGYGRIELISIEGIIGGAGADDLRGDDAANVLQGEGGDDVIDGRGGNDTLYGRVGNDLLHGGEGDDYLIGDDGGNAQPPSGLSGINQMYGDAGNDRLVGGAYNDQMYGGDGDDLFEASWGSDVMDGGAGYDVADLGWHTPIRVDLASTNAQVIANGVVIALNSIEGVAGSGYNDILLGSDSGDNFYGSQGDDTIDGRGGLDVVQYRNAKIESFSWVKIENGWAISDVGDKYYSKTTDQVKNVEFMLVGGNLVFNTLVDNIAFLPLSSAAFPFIGGNLLRMSDSRIKVALSDVGAKLDAGQINPLEALNQIIAKAGQTTSVATLSYQFFTGQLPSIAGLDYLVDPDGVNPNSLNSAYYQSFNLENRYINFAVNLGKFGEGRKSFESSYGSLSLFDATRQAYKAIFGAAPTDAKIHALIDTRTDYFATYGGDGPNGIGTKAAMVGWLLAEAVKADVGVMAKSNDAWLSDTADGFTHIGVNLLDPGYGYYKSDFIFGG